MRKFLKNATNAIYQPSHLPDLTLCNFAQLPPKKSRAKTPNKFCRRSQKEYLHFIYNTRAFFFVVNYQEAIEAGKQVEQIPYAKMLNTVPSIQLFPPCILTSNLLHPSNN